LGRARISTVRIAYVLSAALVVMAHAATVPPLRPAGSIALPAVQGRIDHMSCDPKGQRLFVAALGNNTVEVIDLKSGKAANSIKGFHAPQGIAYDGASNRLIVASRDDGTIKILDGTSFDVITAITKFGDADNLRIDVGTKNILAGYADGALGFFKLDGKQIAEVKLEGHPESFQLEKKGSRVFVNVPTAKHIAVINRESKMLNRTWVLPTDDAANYAMALDEADRRLFVVVRKPPRMLTFDTDSGVLMDQRDTVGDVDDIFYDGAHRRVYISGGDGRVDVVRQTGPDSYEPFVRIATAPGARTSLLVPELNRYFVAAPRRGNTPAQILVYEVSAK
jgi:YVTN family beta-propeller protein